MDWHFIDVLCRKFPQLISILLYRLNPYLVSLSPRWTLKTISLNLATSDRSLTPNHLRRKCNVSAHRKPTFAAKLRSSSSPTSFIAFRKRVCQLHAGFDNVLLIWCPYLHSCLLVWTYSTPHILCTVFIKFNNLWFIVSLKRFNLGSRMAHNFES